MAVLLEGHRGRRRRAERRPSPTAPLLRSGRSLSILLPTSWPNDQSYASPTFSADKRQFHFGARYNYEDQQTGSLWFGYNFEAGDKLLLQATPMIGGVLDARRDCTRIPSFAELEKAGTLHRGGIRIRYEKTQRQFLLQLDGVQLFPVEWCRAGLCRGQDKGLPHHSRYSTRRTDRVVAQEGRFHNLHI